MAEGVVRRNLPGTKNEVSGARQALETCNHSVCYKHSFLPNVGLVEKMLPGSPVQGS